MLLLSFYYHKICLKKSTIAIFIILLLTIILTTILFNYPLKKLFRRESSLELALKEFKCFQLKIVRYEKIRSKSIYPKNIESIPNYVKPPLHTNYYRYYVSEDFTHFIYVAFPKLPAVGRFICFIDESKKIFKTDMWLLWEKMEGKDGKYPDVLQIDWYQKGKERIPGLNWIEITK